ncbi:hypothetical protein [Saccharopolyspora hattusasensis]
MHIDPAALHDILDLDETTGEEEIVDKHFPSHPANLPTERTCTAS